jgi:transposase
MSRAAISPNGRVLRHPGDLEWLERHRLQAADLFAQGKTRVLRHPRQGRQRARRLSADRQPLVAAQARRRCGRMRTARHGKPAQLGPAELGKVRWVLDRGAVAAGFDNDLWTLARVAQVIERTTGVAHHPGHVWRLLKAMRWSLQRPGPQGRRARRDRDRPVGRPGVATDCANARTRRAWLCFIDESASS